MKKVFTTALSLAILILGVLSCSSPAPETSIPSPEAILRAELKIPQDAKRVMILSPNAHMDWDWLNTFPYNAGLTNVDPQSNCQPCVIPDYVAPCSYFSGANVATSKDILADATQKLVDSSNFYYSVCEIGFLRAFAQTNPTLFNQMKATNRMRTVGGGITSPDNLLPNGETFFRNFLVAKQWMDSEQVPWSEQVWLPDDFGHDPQLPVMLQGLDAMGVAFARIPGACDGDPQSFQTPQQILLDSVNGGVDFTWSAADGSEVFAHWLQAHYGQGNNIDDQGSANPIFGNLKQNQDCNKQAYPTTPNEHIQTYIKTNGPVSPTPYIFVDVSGDFMIPYQNLLADANAWNKDPNGYAATGVYAVVATFDHYTRLINSMDTTLTVRSYNPLPNTSAPPYEPFQPNPYWMGYYASRPELKTMHNDATRTLLAAETYQVIANSLIPPTAIDKQNQINALLSAWDSLAPSTHHDYITGTATDDTYNDEQLRMLNSAQSLGNGLASQFVTQVANGLSATQPSVVVFNPLGIQNKGIVDYSVNGVSTPLNVSVESMGYAVVDIAQASQGDNTLGALVNSQGTFYLYNNIASAGFNLSNGDLLSFADVHNSQNILAGTGNEIVVFKDEGDIYRFGYESTATFAPISLTWSNFNVTVDTTNALEKSISVTKTTTIGTAPVDMTITYTLRQGEPFLRISTTGSLPYYYTAMVKFPLNLPIDNVTAGTPYHWNSMTPLPYGNNTSFNATMWATHDFVVPSASGTPLAAIYHGSTPAWTSMGSDLYGVILRNTPPTGYGSCGTDSDPHTQEYALRIPLDITSPEDGELLREARKFNTPMHAVTITNTSGGTLPSTYSLAMASDNTLITAAKWCYNDPNALILRVYQPSNAPISGCRLKLANSTTTCAPVSALEIPIVNAKVQASSTGSGTQYELTLPSAVATFKLE